MITNPIFESMINAPVRAFRGRVEFYEGSTLALMCGCHDNLKSFTVERVGEANKFFGYGICQKINVKLMDPDRSINLSTNNTAEVVFGTGSDYIYPCPRFHITQVRRDENTNELSITAYDDLYKASTYTISEVLQNLTTPYSIRELTLGCAALLGVPVGELDEAFDTYYEEGANFEGTETVREVLTAIAEATQTIYFIDWDWKLQFKRLDVAGEPVLTIDKSRYFTLSSGENRRLTKLCHATNLGDNLITDISDRSGSTQYIRNNPFWELRDDAYTLLEAAAARVGEITINQFDCSWRGNFLLEIGDKIALTTKDDEIVYSYVVNDVIEFDGSLHQNTQWEYDDDSVETFANPTSLGEVINHTIARVDKVNKEIELMTGESNGNVTSVAQLTIDVGNINATVQQIEQQLSDTTEELNDSIATLTSTVETKMNSEQVSIQVKKELDNGVGKVQTGKGFTFNDDGLTITDISEDTNSVITTTISNNGMTVYSDGSAVLTANDAGVKAKDLHATTYLIIGENSRFEDYGYNRTGCFWIGG